ncbi:MAG: hypothetical protein ACJAZ1_000870 [Yoonia sp.]|jgi:hypothetical protein
MSLPNHALGRYLWKNAVAWADLAVFQAKECSIA